DTVPPREKPQVARAGEGREEGWRLDQRTDAIDNRVQSFRFDVQDARAAGGRLLKTEQAPDGRGLACAVRTQEPEHAAVRNRQVEAVDGNVAATAQPTEHFMERLDLDNRHRLHNSLCCAPDGLGIALEDPR